MTSDLSAQSVADYFTRRLGSLTEVRSLHKTFPGVSRETWLVQAEVAGRPEGFVLRIDPPGGPSAPQSLRHEWQVYERLWKSPAPVAEPLWYAEGEAFAQGRPHMVRRLVEGATSPPGILARGPGTDERRKRVVFEHVEKLALVHQLDWKAYGFDSFIDAPASPRDALAADFRYWKALWEKGRTAPFPVITEALGWLEENLPTDTPRISLVKGNNGIGEEIWKDDKIVAMSDWELASLGDGVLDLAFSQGTLDLTDFDAAIRHYEQCVGHEVSPQRLAFASFWIPFKAIVCVNVYGLGSYLRGADRRLCLLSNGLLTTGALEQRLASCIGHDLVAAWRGGPEAAESIYAQIGDSR